jgi:hypothetical protein
VAYMMMMFYGARHTYQAYTLEQSLKRSMRNPDHSPYALQIEH